MRGIFENVCVKHDSLFLAIRPKDASLVRKIALQNEDTANGKGNAYADAMLSLKRAFGIRTDVFYDLEFTTENFNNGEDVSYLDNAFLEGERWRLHFGDKPIKHLRRDIDAYALTENRICVIQYVTCLLPGKNWYLSEGLATVSASIFVYP